MRYFREVTEGLIIAVILVLMVLTIQYKKPIEPIKEYPSSIAPITIAEEEPKPLTAVLPGKEVVIPPQELPKSKIPLSRGGSPLAKIIEDCQVTFYNNEGISYTTKSGTRTVDGVTIAVDPSIIKLGTWVEIHMPDGTVYRRRAEDTGSAVKGKIVDIYANESTKELKKRGRIHGVTVIVLGGE